MKQKGRISMKLIMFFLLSLTFVWNDQVVASGLQKYIVVIDGKRVAEVYGIAILGPKTTWGSNQVCYEIRGSLHESGIGWRHAGIFCSTNTIMIFEATQ